MKHILEYDSWLNESILLDRLNGKLHDIYGEGLPVPSLTIEIADLKKRSFNELNYELDKGYVNFLKKSNGLIFDGVMLYSSKKMPNNLNNWPDIWGFVESNKLMDAYDKEYIFFGHSDMDFFVLNKGNKKFEICDKASMNTVNNNFKSFDAMITFILKKLVKK